MRWLAFVMVGACFDAPPRPAPHDVHEVTEVTPSERVVQLAMGRDHACARVDGELWCWGEGASAQLGDGSATPGLRPPTRLALDTVRHVAAGSDHTCALTDAGAVCWGLNHRGQVDAYGALVWSPVVAPAPAVVAGYDSTCVVDVDVRCRGEALDGLASTPLRDDDVEAGPAWLTPRAIPGLPALEGGALALGTGFGCAIADGVRCFGTNRRDELGGAASLATASATRVEWPFVDDDAVEVAAGSTFACARSRTGRVACWGDNRHQQAGSALGDSVAVPTEVVMPGAAAALALGRRHACALLEDASVACWGDNTRGALGAPDVASSAVPVRVFEQARAVAAGWDATCAARADARVFCWGDDDHEPTEVVLGAAPSSCAGCTSAIAAGQQTCAQVGRTLTCADTIVRDLTLGEPDPRRLSASGATTCVLDAEGAPWCFEVGGTATRVDVVAVAIVVGEARVCAVRSDGELVCWRPSATPSPTGVTLDPLAPLFALAGETTCARLADGSVDCWGPNDRGQLGRGTSSQREERGPVVGLADPEALAGHGRRFCAVSGGELVCWGANDRGALGLASTIDHALVPTRVALPAPIQRVALGPGTTCAASDEAVWCWGDNRRAELAMRPIVATSPAPHRVHLGDAPGHVAVGEHHACADTRRGVLCWGDDATTPTAFGR